MSNPGATSWHDDDPRSDGLVCESPEAMGAEVRSLQQAGETVGFVPTMGALHEGHLSLVRVAAEQASRVVVSIFVNPTQFAPHEDLERYPRTLARDLEQLRELGVRRVFVPRAETMYPEGFSTYVEPPAIAKRWEGEFRPSFFRGVATVVLKLFHIVPADVAVFGQKDYQQAQVIRAMVRDLNLPMRIETAPTAREADGLAMSSRNAYLSDAQRQRALSLSQALAIARQRILAGERDVDLIETAMRQSLEAAPVDAIDYASLADAETLAPQPDFTRPVVALIAAHVGQTRLIDNDLIELPE